VKVHSTCTAAEMSWGRWGKKKKRRKTLGGDHSCQSLGDFCNREKESGEAISATNNQLKRG